MVDIPIEQINKSLNHKPRYTPKQHNAWRDMALIAKAENKEPVIVAYTGWSKGGRGYSPSRFTVRKWPNPPEGMEPYSVHLDHDHEIPFSYFDYCFASSVIFDEAMAELKRQLAFNQRDTKPRSPNRMSDEIFVTYSFAKSGL